MSITNKKEELLTKFDNGFERYNKEPLFNKAIDILLQNNEDFKIKLIDNLLEIIKNYQILIEQLNFNVNE